MFSLLGIPIYIYLSQTLILEKNVNFIYFLFIFKTLFKTYFSLFCLVRTLNLKNHCSCIFGYLRKNCEKNWKPFGKEIMS